ncbi:MAG: hypothetical protein RLZZ227_708 [Pseudomonadota bacterium]|jgi:hypothetical protein
MKPNEKKLVLFAGVLFALVIIVRVLPLAYGYYREGREDIALLDERVDRYRTLVQEQDQWIEREALKRAEIADLESWIFQGSNPNLIGSSVQRALRQTLDQAGIAVRETPVARYSTTGEWLMVTQEMSFTIEQQQILPLLNALQQLRPRLHVVAFQIDRGRRQFSGTITVIGFARAQ